MGGLHRLRSESVAMNTPEKPAKPSDVPAKDDTDSHRLIHSEELFAGSHEVLIEHEGQMYRLRLTRSGKLILHK